MVTAVPKVNLKVDGALITVTIKNSKAEAIRVYPDASVTTEPAFIAFAVELARILELPLKATRKVTSCTTAIEAINV